jgi:hypothetical protein
MTSIYHTYKVEFGLTMLNSVETTIFSTFERVKDV